MEKKEIIQEIMQENVLKLKDMLSGLKGTT